MCKTRYTPKEIAADDKMLFSIPLYQRLFEWEKPQIEQLLKDLRDSFSVNPEKPYYVGMLTVYANKQRGNVLDLVDGQQRFTVMMLMAIAFKEINDDWLKFLKINDAIRLSFFARKKDEEFILLKIADSAESKYTNKKMENAIRLITDFIESEQGWVGKKEAFANYVFEKMTFFISTLPEDYKPTDLNRYFESMNATGRGLENHEILKVELLKKLIDDKGIYTKLWNAVSEMDKPIIRQKHDEKIDDFRNRQIKGLELVSSKLGVLSNLFSSSDEKETSDTIIEIDKIPSIKENPSKFLFRASGERSIITFPEFLLLVLFLQLQKKGGEIKALDFFNVHKLQETFKQLEDTEVKDFFENLLKYRLLFDYYIIKVSNNDQNSTTYTLAADDFVDSENWNSKAKLIQYQSMLYVSTSYNIWLPDILLMLEGNRGISTDKLLEFIKTADDFRRTKSDLDSLKYGSIDRYWFWRLDYYLWEQWKNQEDEEISKVIRSYTFRSNRSIEHLHPQNPSIKSKEDWSEQQLHSFGNLAMISSSFNSTQSNDDENVKFARIENQIAGKNLLESIKLLYMYQKAKEEPLGWTVSKAEKHEEEMKRILMDSFPEKTY